MPFRTFAFGFAAAAALSLAAALPVSAQTKVSIGTLTCTGGAGLGLIIGSKKSYQCSFTPSSRAETQRYRGSVTKIGLDIGRTGRTVMVWTVLAGTRAVRPGMLAGNYYGAAADAAIGVGGGAKVLIGGLNRSIVLQPLSVQGQRGLNLAVGVAGMTLR